MDRPFMPKYGTVSQVLLQLVVAFTSPNVTSTSRKNVLTSRIDFTVLLLFEFLKKTSLAHRAS